MFMTPSTDLPDPHFQAEFYADVPMKRLVAWIFDTVVITLLCLLILPFTAFTALFFFPLFFLVVGSAYRIVTLANRSATWGMRLMSIEMRSLQAERFGLGTALVHTVLYSLSMAFVVPQVISIVLMLTTPRAQGLSDLFLGTVALNRRSGG